VSTARTRRWTELAAVVLPPWALARVAVGGSLALVRHVLTELNVVPRPIQAGQGLFAWDGAFYADIARSGYDAVPRAGLRFFPLFPLLGRAVAVLPGVDTDLALLIVVAIASLVFSVGCYELAVHETGDRDLARRAVWLAALAPPAFVLVMGYAEAPLMALAVVTALAVRKQRFALAAVCGYLAGLTRPVGAILAVFVVVEIVTTWRTRPRGGRALQVVAAIAPAAGLFTYLVWVQQRVHEGFFYAFHIQESPRLRGRTVNPATNLVDSTRELFTGDRFGPGMHAVTALVLIVLLVVLVRRWPWPYTAYAAATLAVAMTASNLDSLERYALSTFPFVLAAATLVRPAWERVVWFACGAGLVALSVLAFTGTYVP
jgi:hypothetical protein